MCGKHCDGIGWLYCQSCFSPSDDIFRGVILPEKSGNPAFPTWKWCSRKSSAMGWVLVNIMTAHRCQRFLCLWFTPQVVQSFVTIEVQSVRAPLWMRTHPSIYSREQLQLTDEDSEHGWFRWSNPIYCLSFLYAGLVKFNQSIDHFCHDSITLMLNDSGLT